MSSTIAWLDFSEEEQRRAREIVALFSQQESRDELGIGTIRDALSDAMFPGISVLQTRARYFLFVPWLFKEGERRGRRSADLIAWIYNQERRLIEALRAGGCGGIGEGLIGRIAGPSLKILPSTIYWNGLQRFEVLRYQGTVEQLADVAGRSVSIEEALTEMVDRADGLWDANMPGAPNGFFAMDEASFALERAEADWLAERIASSVPESLLAWLVESAPPIDSESAGVWHVAAIENAPAHLWALVHHAELFALVMQGAALLYNLLLAERSHDTGLDPEGVRIVQYRDWLASWSQEVGAQAGDLLKWDRDRFWRLVTDVNPGISLQLRSRSFVNRWVDFAISDGPKLADRADARGLVRDREREQKKGQSRLVNDRLLRQWGGSSGAGRLSFRWAQVKRILQDVAEGRGTHAGA